MYHLYTKGIFISPSKRKYNFMETSETSPLIYTPQQPKQNVPKSEYVLVEDVTGDPPPVRGPQLITVVKQNEKKEQVKVQIQVPFPPNKKCKKCYGRGYIGVDSRNGNVLACKKCYPPTR